MERKRIAEQGKSFSFISNVPLSLGWGQFVHPYLGL